MRNNMILQEVKALKGSYHFVGMIPNNEKMILFSNKARLYDLYSEKTIQFIPGMSNGIATIAHNQKTLCIISAKGNHIFFEQYLFDNVLTRIRQVAIKGFNSDGGKPSFSPDDRYVIFSIDAKRLYRYDCNTGDLQCIYQPRWQDQFFTFHMDGEKVLIHLKSFSNYTDHIGFEIININGQLLHKINFHENSVAFRSSIFVDWLSNDTILIYYALQLAAKEDLYQIIPLESSTLFYVSDAGYASISKEVLCCSLECTHDHKYVVISNYNYKNTYSDISIYTSDTMQKVFQFVFPKIHSINVSADSRYIFISADKNYLLNLNDP